MPGRNPISLLVWLSLVIGGLSPAAALDKPNILLVLSDDHSFPHVGCYGNANCRTLHLTPNLDAFAAAGMRFDRAYTTAPQCAPSRTSIFAGRSPVALGVTRFAQPARPDVRFFTDVLRANGYWVGLDGRHQHLDGRIKDAEHIQQTLADLGMRNLEARFDHFVRAASTGGKELARVPDKIGAALDKVPPGKPFFLYFGFNQTHRRFGSAHEGIDPAQLELPADWPDLPEVREDYARYLADVRKLDVGIGLIDKFLAERGLKDNTLVIFMGDNGESLLRGKGTLFDRGIHVPLIIRWPGKVAPGAHSDALISGVDLAPTILAAAGLDVPQEMTGVSFLPVLLGQPFTGREYVFAERGYHGGPLTRTDGLDFSRAIITRRYHYIYNAVPHIKYAPVDMVEEPAWAAIESAHRAGGLSELHDRLLFQDPRPVEQLYDREQDPFQTNNLAGNSELSATKRQLRIELDKWMIREGDFLPLPTTVLPK